ncbi:envelope stress response membrane protein PspB [Sphingomonas sabuli]|uniref:Envelope stress response membrane protein PspB n=1 Tax=Sphingomonas sabuli TaxID=2764186 RepID=A0A7G9L386_9SPHN|nr:envelope stress response membrane protein PspB [Sphingomonas sabuli]QNM83085.1 envelope stress response membrane protein PspB [Sphingomonas sabuli]
MGELVPVLAIVILFLGLPWLIFHYVTKWKSAATLTGDDEKLLDELHDISRRLDERMCTIERIMAAENPNWQRDCLPDVGTTVTPDLNVIRERTRIRSGEGA